jgi:ribosomal protein S18 acetylase RimI-like enzyme
MYSEVAGFSSWVFPKPKDPNAKPVEVKDPIAGLRSDPQPEGSDIDLVFRFKSQSTGLRMKYIDPELHYCTSSLDSVVDFTLSVFVTLCALVIYLTNKISDMGILGVRPKYQRRGLGTMLLAAELAHIDQEKAVCFILASAAGQGLYIKHGWVAMDEVVMDYSAVGGPSNEITLWMIRQPRETST